MAPLRGCFCWCADAQLEILGSWLEEWQSQLEKQRSQLELSPSQL